MAGASKPVDVYTKRRRIARLARQSPEMAFTSLAYYIDIDWLLDEDGCITHPDQGSPQGGVVSPMLSNIFLHSVLDEWFERDVQPRLKGRSFLIRYADDFVMGFSCEEDARRVMDVLPKRFVAGTTRSPVTAIAIVVIRVVWYRIRIGGHLRLPSAY